MWGTSSPDDKLAGDLARATEATKIAGRRSDRLLAGKLSPRNFGLLQQNPRFSDETISLRNGLLIGVKRSSVLRFRTGWLTPQGFGAMLVHPPMYVNMLDCGTASRSSHGTTRFHQSHCRVNRRMAIRCACTIRRAHSAHWHIEHPRTGRSGGAGTAHNISLQQLGWAVGRNLNIEIR